jgi:hypothetical protein
MKSLKAHLILFRTYKSDLCCCDLRNFFSDLCKYDSRRASVGGELRICPVKQPLAQTLRLMKLGNPFVALHYASDQSLLRGFSPSWKLFPSKLLRPWVMGDGKCRSYRVAIRNSNFGHGANNCCCEGKSGRNPRNHKDPVEYYFYTFEGAKPFK